MSEARPATTTPVPAEFRRAPAPAACGAAPATAAVARELWLAAHFPQLPLEALLPMAGGARAAGLELHERRPAAEAALLDRLARWALQFTPAVSIEPPAALVAEVRGSLGLFGGAMALCRRAQAGLRAAGLRANVALAPTPRGALWLARAGIGIAAVRADAMPGLAARLPLACLAWPADVIGTLSALGIRNVADLARLPRDGFTRRFGPALQQELDEGLGRRRQPRRRHVVPERFDERLELPAETGSTAQLEPAAERLLAGLGAFLRARASGLSGLRVDLLHRERAPTRIRIGLTRPSGHEEHLRLLLRERLAQCRLPATVVALRFRSGVLLPLSLRDAGLFEQGRAADPEATARLLERLRARLGEDAVFGVCSVPEHRPERAWRIAEPGGTTPLPGHWPVSRPARPLWMLAEPQQLAGWDGVLVTGPERIETGWWDGHDVRRDYYVAMTRGGVRLWIFRERPPGQGWFLHGVFG